MLPLEGIVDDLLIREVRVRHVPCESKQLPHGNTECKHVRFFREFSIKALGCHPSNGHELVSTDSVVVRLVESLVHAKISYLHGEIISDEAISSGDVSMDKLSLCQVLHRAGNLGSCMHKRGFGDLCVAARSAGHNLRVPLQELVEVSFLWVLHDHKALLTVAYPKQASHIGMSDL